MHTYAEQFGTYIGARDSFMAHYHTKTPLSAAPLQGKDDMCALVRSGYCSCKTEGAADLVEWKTFYGMWDCCANL